MTRVSRKQKTFPGMERKEIPEIAEACDRLSEARSERKSGTKKLAELEKQREVELITIMRQHDVKLHRFHDDEGEEVEAKLEEITKVHVRKTGEAESEIGEGVESADEGGSATPPPNKLAEQAERDAAEANVAESDGDVVVPDKAAPKWKKRARPSKSGAKKSGKGRKR